MTGKASHQVWTRIAADGVPKIRDMEKSGRHGGRNGCRVTIESLAERSLKSRLCALSSEWS